MFKKLGVVCLCLSLVPAAYAAELPTEFSQQSKYKLDYSDLNAVLGSAVLDMGPSTHKRAKKPRSSTSSRMVLANPLPSRLEGNRVMYDKFQDAQVAYLQGMRDDLLAIPSQLPIEQLSKDEQLAYWFNLHNSIVLAKLAEEYPVTRLAPFFDPEDEDAFYRQRNFDLSGTMISLEDIQNHVVENWDDPLVIYGFYMGAVGTPNVRKAAFTGSTVYKDLKANAVDYVNSVRGTQVWKKKELRVSKYYERMAAQFPNFEEDVLAHVRQYAKPAFLAKMEGVSKVNAKIEDWYIADLYNGKLAQVGGSSASNATDALGINIVSDLPHHVVELLRYRDEKNADMKRQGIVDVEEVVDGR